MRRDDALRILVAVLIAAAGALAESSPQRIRAQAHPCLAPGGSGHDYFSDSGAFGAVNNLSLPMAVSDNNRTYVSWQGIDHDPCITFYNHNSGSWATNVNIASNPLRNEDDHGGGAVLVDDDGYIHVFCCAHNTEIKYYRSQSPRSIGDWDDRSSNLSLSEATYPQVMQFSDDRISLFFHNGGLKDDWGFKYSDDHGRTWSTQRRVLEGVGGSVGDGWYARFFLGAGDRVHAVFVYYDADNDKGAPPSAPAYWRYNVYYVWRDPNGEWKNVGGAHTFTTPITKADADRYALVYDSASRNQTTQVPWLVSDADNNPYILFTTGPYYGQDCRNGYKYRFASWGGTVWQINNLGAATDNLFDFYALDRGDSPGTFHAYVVKDGTPATCNEKDDRGGAIEKWVSPDGGNTWSYASRVIRNRHDNPQIVKNDNADARLIFKEQTGDISADDHKVYLWGDGGFVQR